MSSFAEQRTNKSPSSIREQQRPLGIDQTEPEKVPYEHSLHERLKTIAGIAGNVLEWYDFAVFGFFGDISTYLCYLLNEFALVTNVLT